MGVISSTLKFVKAALDQNFPPKPTWSTKDIPDLTGKIAIVTGGNAGIGKEIVKGLLEHNAKVYLAARNPQKGEAAIRELSTQTGKDAHLLIVDLADLTSVKAAAEEFTKKETELHILFNNGGVMMTPMDQLSAQGFDLQFGTNCLGHFYLTKLLLPVLKSTAAKSPEKHVRVVTTSSFGHFIWPHLDFNTLKDSPARRKFAPEKLYYQSNVARMLFSFELARKHGGDGVVSIVLHPGTLNTDLFQNSPKFAAAVIRTFFKDASYGALTPLRAGTDPEGVNWNGKYLKAWARLGDPHPNSLDEPLAAELWKYMEEQTSTL